MTLSLAPRADTLDAVSLDLAFRDGPRLADHRGVEASVVDLRAERGRGKSYHATHPEHFDATCRGCVDRPRDARLILAAFAAMALIGVVAWWLR